MADYTGLLQAVGATNPWPSAIEGIQQHLVQQAAAERQRQLNALQLQERNERLLEQQRQRKLVEQQTALTHLGETFAAGEAVPVESVRTAVAAGVPFDRFEKTAPVS